MTQLKMSYEYQTNVKIKDAYAPYHDFMNTIDIFGWLKNIGIYSDINGDPGFRRMVDIAINSAEINSSTFVPSLSYIKSFNKQLTSDLIGVVDLGITAGLVTEVAVSGVTVSTVGVAESAVIPAAGYTATQWEEAVNNAMSMIEDNRINHILLEHHYWDRLVSNPTFDRISMYIQQTILYGENCTLYNNYPGKRMIFEGNTVEVQYNIINGIMKIVDAWIVNK